MTGTDVTYATRSNETFDGYLGAAAGAGKVPGIPLITAIFGVDQIPMDEVNPGRRGRGRSG
jgi:hypothetical protein